MITPQLAKALRDLRAYIERKYLLRTESVSMMRERWTDDYPNAPQIAIILPDPRFPHNMTGRARDEQRILDLLTTPNMPLVEIDRTPTRVWLAVVSPRQATS